MIFSTFGKKRSSVYLLLILLLASCETETEKGLDQYYPYRSVTVLKLSDVPKTDYFIGLDRIDIPLLATAFNAAGEEVEVSDEVIYFTVNDERLDDNSFTTQAEGTYQLVAHLGKIASDTITVRALDPSKLSLHISADASQQSGFVADGKASLDFQVKLFHNGVAVPLSSQFILYCNNEVIGNRPFTTRRAGEYKFKASGANLVSNEIVIEAPSPVKTLRLSKENNDLNFFGYNISETGLVLEGLDGNGQSVALSEEIKLYKDDIEIDKNTKFKTNDLGRVTFRAKGYKNESNEISIDVKSPVKSLKLAYSRVGNIFWADGVSEISLSLQAFDFNGQSIAPTPDVKLFFGSQVIDYTKRFTTTQSGDLKFKAKGFNSESEEITVTAVAPANYKVVRIPVIFHEVNTTALTEAKINEIISGVSKAFRNQWNSTGGPKDPNSSDLFIEVYAAERDPSGNLLAIKGLNRVKSQKQTFKVDNSKSLNEAVEDAWAYYWNPEQYFNIWVYPNMEGDFYGASWAYFPFVTQHLQGVGVLSKGRDIHYTYGAFLNARHLGPGDGVQVTAHEMGHALGLSHVFDGDLSTHNGCSKGDPDYCQDTKYYDRGAYEQNIVTASRYNRTSCDGETYVATNFMDYFYSHDNSFTFDQRSRVRHVINYALWLPTPFNGFNNGRKTSNGYMKKPADFKYTKPVSCIIPVD
ncbi:M43 family zinc metalloprotease [Dyadobacter psychrotolerans]|uniref:Peptidase M43 pregnancy-associated plasma-A domain-containing protein n=1 Tax=Dyadobacter psychrotolerans TaxID=2541721 RepID=A0A4V2Z4L2_9BACT|nr:M43 family zinc metalloprotease [Dyadobacter psychrotolerans]TDE17098.1 hypothetical protein E0F88_04135 [Dyadobacter psychrotolerans]